MLPPSLLALLDALAMIPAAAPLTRRPPAMMTANCLNRSVHVLLVDHHPDVASLPKRLVPPVPLMSGVVLVTHR